MICETGKSGTIQVKVKVIQTFHYGQWLFLHHVVIPLGLIKLATVVGHYILTTMLLLREYCSYSLRTSQSSKYNLGQIRHN